MTSTYDAAPAKESQAILYEVRAHPPRVQRQGEVVFEAETEDDLVPWLELDWYERAIDACRDNWVLHAACVERGGRALVLAGPSGAGKTTLAWALLARGAGYLSDECTAIDGRGAIGLSRPLSFAEGELPSALPPGFAAGGYPFTKRDGQAAWSEHLRPPHDRVRREALPVAALICLRHAPQEPPSVRPLTAAEALLALWPLTFEPSFAGLSHAVAALQRTPVFALTTRDVAGALGELDRLVPGG
jgi:hypothetical protein